jgi:hypothetical protein
MLFGEKPLPHPYQLWGKRELPQKLMRTTSRLAGAPDGAKIIQVPNGDLTGIDIANLVSRRFDLNDMYVIQTAKELHLSLLTTNAAMISQISDNLDRRNVWGLVPIIVPIP